MDAGLPATLFSIAVIAVFLLTGGGLYLLVKRGERQKGALMLLCALVLLVNVGIWTL